MYSPNLFYHQFIPGNAQQRMTALGRLCNHLGLTPGDNCTVEILRPWQSKHDSRREFRITFDVNMKALTPRGRRALKKFVKLEVPSYAMGGVYKEPPLCGLVTIRSNCMYDGAVAPDHIGFPSDDAIELDFTVNGAYVCTQTGTQEKEPAQWEVERANKLLAMTPEEIIAKHREEAEEMLKPKMVPSYKCAATVEGE